MTPAPGFAAALIDWHARHGRHDLPWHGAADPYRVWLSEIMLQQTQVGAVIPYFERFVARFPDVHALAAAAPADVMALWSGLGYYARARNLHAAARLVVARHGGRLPASAAQLAALPGIGRSTAAAIASFCWGERVAILDGNVRRVLARYHGIAGDPASAAVARALWERADQNLPASAAAMPAYTQAIMDLGATVCVRRAPRCGACPVSAGCVALRDDRIAQLPAPRARRAAPLRRAYWLLACGAGGVLLEQRPGAGLWGGLLAPPEFASLRALRAAARALGGAGRTRALPPRRVAFTHFTLEVVPHRVALAPAPAHAAEARYCWLALDRADAAPLPAPVKVLIAELRETAVRDAG